MKYQIYKYTKNCLLFNNNKQYNHKLGSLGRFLIKLPNGKTFSSSEEIYHHLMFTSNCEPQKQNMAIFGKPLYSKLLAVHNYDLVKNECWEHRILFFGYSLLVKTKYSEDFRKVLLSTNDKTLIEYDYWSNDKENIFACQLKNGFYEGYNMHGKLLMRIRTLLQNGEFDTTYENVKKQVFNVIDDINHKYS